MNGASDCTANPPLPLGTSLLFGPYGMNTCPASSTRSGLRYRTPQLQPNCAPPSATRLVAPVALLTEYNFHGPPSCDAAGQERPHSCPEPFSARYSSAGLLTATLVTVPAASNRLSHPPSCDQNPPVPSGVIGASAANVVNATVCQVAPASVDRRVYPRHPASRTLPADHHTLDGGSAARVDLPGIGVRRCGANQGHGQCSGGQQPDQS